MFFCVSIHDHVTLDPRIATHDAFINSYLEFKFQLSKFYCLLVMSKPILIRRNSRTKTTVLRAHTKSQLRYFPVRIDQLIGSSIQPVGRAVTLSSLSGSLRFKFQTGQIGHSVVKRGACSACMPSHLAKKNNNNLNKYT